MNCMGPTARSQVVSWSQRPPSVSAIAAYPWPSRTGPRTAGTARWLLSRPRPASEPDSTWPIAASSPTGRWHEVGMEEAAER
jgi:hypothetical protein